MAQQTFDMVVIGAGPGGYVSAIRGSQLGMKVAIVEREHLGGICLNWGCIPTKTLLRSSEIFHVLQRAGDFGIQVEGMGFDLPAIIERSRRVARQLNAGVGHLLRKNGIKVIMGKASFEQPKVLQVHPENGEPRRVEGQNIVIATGARARELPGLPTDGKVVWSYKHALVPDLVPERLLVVGSGAIGIEFASFFNTLGSKTTVVEIMDRILPTEDEEISGLARKQFEKQGMRFLTGARLESVDIGDDVATAVIRRGEETVETTFDRVISAVGIIGNTEDLNLREIGVSVDRGHIQVDSHSRTSAAGIYAIGDVAGPPWLAHKASHEGITVAEQIAGMSAHPVKADSIAGCIYSWPQIASIGMTEAAAHEAGHTIRVGRFPFVGNGKALALGESEGLVKTIFDSETGELLGAHMIGTEVTELIQGYIVARNLETTEAELMQTVFPHPTLSEMMHESVLDAYDSALHF